MDGVTGSKVLMAFIEVKVTSGVADIYIVTLRVRARVTWQMV